MKTLFLLLCWLALSFSQAATLDQQADAHFTRGEAAEKRGDAKVASLCYQLAQRTVPGHPASLKRLQEIGKAAGVLGPDGRINGKLILPQVRLSKATLEDAVKYLKAKTQQHSPLGQGVDFTQTATSKATITLDLKNVPLDEALRFITELAGVSYCWENGSVQILPLGQKTAPPIEAGTPSPANQIHTWTNQSGVTINAAFVGLDGDAVVIRKDGKEFTIPFSKLNASSQELAMKLSVAQPSR